MEVTESQLAGALERFYVTVESGGGDGRGNLLTARGPVADADETAEALYATLSRMAALREPEPDAVTVTLDEVTRALTGFVLWTRAGDEPRRLGHPDNPAATARALLGDIRRQQGTDRERARRGVSDDPWAPGEPEPDGDVVDAHVHCDHVLTSRADSELAIADQVVRLLEPLGYAGSRRLKRVLRWAWDYLTDGDEPPF